MTKEEIKKGVETILTNAQKDGELLAAKRYMKIQCLWHNVIGDISSEDISLILKTVAEFGEGGGV